MVPRSTKKATDKATTAPKEAPPKEAPPKEAPEEAPKTLAKEASKPTSLIEVVPVDGIEAALDPDAIPAEDKKRALVLVRYSTTSPNHGTIRQKLSKLDPRAVAWAVREYGTSEEITIRRASRTADYDLGFMRTVTDVSRPIPPGVIPPAAAALLDQPPGK